MNRSFSRGALLCLALISPLLVASCSSPASKGHHTALAEMAGQLCTSCVDFNVYAWKFKPDAGVEVTTLLDIAPDLTEKNTSADLQRLYKEARPAEIQRLLRQSGRAEPVLNFHSMTTKGRSLPVSTGGAEGKFSAVLMPVPLTTDAPDLISFELNSEVPFGGFTHGNAVYSKGSFPLKEGDALLYLQKVSEGYVVWLILAKNPV